MLPLIVGHSPALHHAMTLARLYASIPHPVLLLGPTGVGKGLIARFLHAARGDGGPFVSVPGGQLVESLFHSQLFGHVRGAYTGADRQVAGAFERARGGTLFLDELPLWSRAAQSAVLQAVDERVMVPVGGEREVAITCRFVFASNRSLDELEAEGLLLKDLRHRIGDFMVQVPPLTSRGGDVLELAYYFLDKEGAGLGSSAPVMFEHEVIELLSAFDWPGNVRQLRNAVAFACVHAAGAERIRPEHLPPYLRAQNGTRPLPLLDAASRAALTAWALERARGSRRKAAELLGVHPNTIAYRQKRLETRG
jgi:DNA-binding NtrC family response regulator